MIAVRFLLTIICAFTVFGHCVRADESIVDSSASTDVDYSLKIKGTISAPSPNGPITLPLESSGKFRFATHRFPTDVGGPMAIRAVREFQLAETETVVAKDHRTRLTLSRPYRFLHIFGSHTGLEQVSPTYLLPRRELDLIQMPFDVLATDSLAPPSIAAVEAKSWNTDSWVVPMLSGLQAVAEQSVVCTLKEESREKLVVSFQGKAEGAVDGSGSTLSFAGEFTINRETRIISELKVTQKEKRSPGPVSPGLDVTIEVQWTQKPTRRTDKPVTAVMATDAQRRLVVRTPVQLQMKVGRDWHVFHEAGQTILLRQLKDGELISQCNLTRAITVPPGEHTSDAEFLDNVKTLVAESKGSVVNQETIRDDKQWRVRHVQAVGDAGGEVIVWDYFLCSEAGGRQFSLLFSHARKDEKKYANAAGEILKGISLMRTKPKLPFQ